MLKILFSLVVSLSFASASKAEKWVSLYRGLEKSFSQGDREKLRKTLEALGVEHKESAEAEFLVQADSRPVVQNLVAQMMTRLSKLQGENP